MAVSGFVSTTSASIPTPSLLIRNPIHIPTRSLLPVAFSPNSLSLRRVPFSPNSLSLRRVPFSPNSLSLRHHHRPSKALEIRCSSIASPSLPASNLLSESTRTLTSLVSFSISAIRHLSAVIAAAASPTPSELAQISSLRDGLACTVGPLFFAALRNRPSGHLNTPLTVVASGMGKWLEIYSGVLMVRVLLSWFPNIPWHRQPLSAIRDLCDPYLNLFRNIIPPIFDTLDISPLLAFAVLGTLSTILRSTQGL